MSPVLGLRAALILLVLIAIAPVVAVVVQSSVAEQRARLQRIEASLKSVVDLAAAHQQRTVEGARQLLTAIVSAPPVYEAGQPGCAAYLRKLQAQYPQAYGTFGLLDAQGNLTCRAVAPTTSVSSRDRKFFRAAMGTGRFSVGEYTVSRASGRRVLPFGMPVFRDDSKDPIGVAYLAVDLAETAAQLRDITVTPELTLLVADGDGIVLAAAGPDAPAVGTTVAAGFLRNAVAAGQPRVERTRGEDGNEWLVAFQPVGRANEARLFVAGMASSDAIVAPAAERLRKQLGALALLMLLASALAWLFAGRVLIGPMQRLLDQVDALAHEGERLDGPPPQGALREFTELHRHFHAMARRLAERAIQRDGAMAEMEHQKNLLESVLQSMAEGLVVIDGNGRFAHINPAAQRILPGLRALGLGRNADLAQSGQWGLFELDGKTPVAADARPSVVALRGDALEHYRYIARGALAGGRELVIQASARPILDPSGRQAGAVVVFADITEAWRAEQALRDSEQRYRSLFESNPHPMWVFDVESQKFLTVNDAAVAHYGYSREEFLSMNIQDIRPEDEVPQLKQALLSLRQPIGRPRIWQHRLKDGRIIHAEVTSHAMDYQGRPARMVLAHDVTEMLAAQEAMRHLNETLERRVGERTRELAAANHELESFSYSVSHDLRAPLQVIDGFGRALAARHGDRLDGQARHYLDRIRDNTRQMAQLIDDLLALARVTRADLVSEEFDLAPYVQRTVEQLRDRFPERSVRIDVEEPLPCRGDPRLLAVVMENLIGNAWKFTSRKDEPVIRVGRRTLEDGLEVYFVSDNGAGFEMAYSDKLFKAFQRLHAASDFEGTGIGLATVHRIISRHGGRVWAESRQGEGATFQFSVRPADRGNS